MEPKITVIIPIYNAEEYLSECLESVLCQSLREIEILCINDGSIDKSVEIIKEYAVKDNRIIFLQQENQGVAVARNNGIQNAHGKYVAFMDADDYYPDEYVLETLFKAAEENNVLIAGGEFSILLPNGTIDQPERFRNDPFEFGYYFEKEGIIKYQDYQFDYGYHRFIYNKNFLIENNLFFPLLTRFQDPPFFVKTIATAKIFYAIKKTTYRYRLGEATSGCNWSDKKLLDLHEGLLENLSFAEKNGYNKLLALTSRRITDEYRWSQKELNTRLNYAYNQNQVLLKQVTSINNSYSYKLGLIMTILPRKLVHFFLNLKSFHGHVK